jgi:hypothetical protein
MHFTGIWMGVFGDAARISIDIETCAPLCRQVENSFERAALHLTKDIENGRV